jgi:hypothetical protein
VRITWAIEGRGAGSADVATVEEAATALSRAVTAVHERTDPTTLATILERVVAPLRASLVTDGRQAVERGDEWSASRGGILVQLSR